MRGDRATGPPLAVPLLSRCHAGALSLVVQVFAQPVQKGGFAGGHCLRPVAGAAPQSDRAGSWPLLPPHRRPAASRDHRPRLPPPL